MGDVSRPSMDVGVLDTIPSQHGEDSARVDLSSGSAPLILIHNVTIILIVLIIRIEPGVWDFDGG